MDILNKLPQEIENKVFYMIAEHPCSTIIKDEYNRLLNDFILQGNENEFDFDFINAFKFDNYGIFQTCDFCHKNGRRTSREYLIREGDYIFFKCLNKKYLVREEYN